MYEAKGKILQNQEMFCRIFLGEEASTAKVASEKAAFIYLLL